MTIDERIRVSPMGGVGEVGKNSTLIEFGGDLVIVDAGVKFPETELHGVDLVVPDYGYVADRLDSLLGILAGGGILFAVIVLSGGGMGGGDMKLGAMMGAFLGYRSALLALFVAVILGGAVALALLSTGVRKRKDPIPFGPFLAAASALAMLWGEAVLGWYLSVFSPSV